MGGCECKNLINENGLGNCQKEYEFLGNQLICYVQLPSTCTDLQQSATNAGEFYSAEACNSDVAPVPEPTPAPTPSSESAGGCECKNLINENGLGNCQKEYEFFGNQLICYVQLPSTCTDLQQSATNAGEFYSAE